MPRPVRHVADYGIADQGVGREVHSRGIGTDLLGAYGPALCASGSISAAAGMIGSSVLRTPGIASTTEVRATHAAATPPAISPRRRSRNRRPRCRACCHDRRRVDVAARPMLERGGELLIEVTEHQSSPAHAWVAATCR